MNGQPAGTRNVRSDRRRRTARQFLDQPAQEQTGATPAGSGGNVTQHPTARRGTRGTTPNDAA